MKAKTMIAFLGAALVFSFLTACRQRSNSSGQANNAAALKVEDRPLSLGQFQRIQGTRFLMAEITEAQARSGFSSSSSLGTGSMRNLMFLDGESLASHRLFETNANVILDTDQYPYHDKESGPVAPGNPLVTQWLVYRIVKGDTNGDGRLDSSDRQTIGVTDAGGAGYAEILSGLDQVLGMMMARGGQLVIVYSRDGTRNTSVIDLDKRAIVLTKALSDPGPDVK